jgi:hypothetical protein
MKLLPCPFCGSDDVAFNTIRYSEATVAEQGWRQNEFYGVNCVVCGVNNSGLVGHSSQHEAGTAWNCRAITFNDGKTP